MKKILLFFTAIIAVGFLYGSREPRLLTVLFTNDSHGMAWAFDQKDNPDIGGLAARKTLVDRIRREVQLQNGDVVLVSSGNITMGDPRSNICENLPIVKGMNLIAYDAMVIGNHEFDFGMRIFKKMKKEARFPFLSVNAYRGRSKKLLGIPYFEKELVNDVKVAFAGVTSLQTQHTTNAGVEGKIRVENPIETTKTVVKKLKEKNDFVIVLSNLGYYEDRKSPDGFSGDRHLAEDIKEIDLIIGGRTKTYMKEPVTVNDTPIVQTEGLGKWLGRFDFFFEGKELIKTDFKLYPINLKKKIVENGKEKYKNIGRKLKGNKAMTDMLNSFNCDFSTQVLGETGLSFSADRQKIRYEESSLGNLITDIMRSRTDSDFAVLNSGSIRQGLDKGFVNEMDIYSVFPFDDTVVTGTMKGETVRKFIEEFSNKKPGDGSFLQISGMELTISGDEIKSININGKALEDEKDYKFAVNSFLADGGDGYNTLKNHKKKKNTGYSVPGIIVEYIKREKYINKPEPGRLKISD